MSNKVGFIGTGEIAAIHAEAIKRLGGGLSIAGAYDVLGTSAAVFCAKYGGRVYQDSESLITDKEIDTLYICTRHDSHVTLSLAAIKAGKAIFLEKPVAMNSKDAHMLLEQYEKTPVPMAVGYNMRVSPAALRFKELMGEYGVKPESFRANMTGAPFMSGWATDPKEGGGVLVGLGSHMFDLITHLLGSPIKRLCAAVQHISLPEIKEGNSATILLQLENGVCGTLLLHDRGCREYHVEPEGRMTNITAYSPQGTFDVDAYGKVRYGTSKGFCEEIPSGRRDQCSSWGYEKENAEFLKLLNGNKTELCTIEQAVRVADAVEAARRSNSKKSWAEI